MPHVRARRSVSALTAVIALGLAFGTIAQAGSYDFPDVPQDQGSPQANTGKRKTLKVCKRGCKYKSLQKAVDKARAGDRITVGPGKYRGGAFLRGSGKDRIQIVGLGKGKKKKKGLTGAPKSARKVVLDGKGVSGAAGDNGILALGVDGLVVRNMSFKNFKSNGIFIRGEGTTAAGACNDYTMKDLYARNNKGYGLFSFNCMGGKMSDSEALRSGDSGFYMGGTPPQASPKRSTVKRVRAYQNAQGWSGTNVRYVTISDSDWFNNGLGLSMSALDSEPFKPADQNVIEENRIFWNNVDPYATGAKAPPFVPAGIFTEFAPIKLPGVGDGIWLIGGDNTVIRDNQIFGNYLHGVAIMENITLDPAKGDPPGTKYPPKGNKVTGNKFGRNGTDKNGVADLFFAVATATSGNCASNAGQTQDLAGGPALPACPSSAANPAVASQIARALSIALAPGGGPSTFWVRAKHPALKGFTPFKSNPQ